VGDKHRDHLVRICDTADSAQLLDVLESIAGELSWQPGQQLRSYASTAIHFAAYVNGVLAGGLQLVPATLCKTLPCELVWPEVSLPSRAETAHISIMAVHREYRGSAGLMWPLCVAMWRYCVAHCITDITLEVTPKTYHLYRRLGWPLEIVGELRPHWGDDLCYLCRMGAIEVAGAMLLKAPRSAAYRDIVGQMSRPWEAPVPFPLQPAAVSGIVVTEVGVTGTQPE
jgi:hypothetical protein